MSGKPADRGREEGGRKKGREGWFGWPCAVLTHCIGLGLVKTLPVVRPLTQCDRAVRVGWAGTSSPCPGKLLGGAGERRMAGRTPRTQHGQGLHFSFHAWPSSCGGVELGPITASSSWSLCSTTLEPWWSPRHVGFSDAPEAMMLCNWALIKPERFLTGVR